MTCKDCFYFDMCFEVRNNNYFGFTDGSELLTCFKDKSKIIELPFNVGDTVYAYCDTFGSVFPYFIEQIHIMYDSDNGNHIVFEANTHSNDNPELDELLDSIDFYIEDIGKTVFPTKEAAWESVKVPMNTHPCSDCKFYESCDNVSDIQDVASGAFQNTCPDFSEKET